MSRTSSTFKLGLFVLGAVALVFVALFAFGLRRRLEERTEFETYVTGSVSGVAVGSAVKLRGVHVGEVTHLEFSWNEYPGGTPSCVVVHFDVRTSALPRPPDVVLEQAVQRGLRAIVETAGITGAAFLSLTDVNPAENPPLHVTWIPNHPVIPSAPSELDQIIRSVRTVVSSLQQVNFERLGTRLDSLIDTAEGSLRALDRLDAQRLSGDLRASADRFGAASADVGALAKDVRGALHGLQLEALGRNASGLVTSLRDTNARLQLLIDRLSDVETQDLHETLGSLHEAVRGLNEAIAELRGYPPGFFFGEAPPPARSVERSR
jgi:ABC-type transporter Mla subunit MlaD